MGIIAGDQLSLTACECEFEFCRLYSVGRWCAVDQAGQGNGSQSGDAFLFRRISGVSGVLCGLPPAGVQQAVSESGISASGVRLLPHFVYSHSAGRARSVLGHLHDCARVSRPEAGAPEVGENHLSDLAVHFGYWSVNLFDVVRLVCPGS